MDATTILSQQITMSHTPVNYCATDHQQLKDQLLLLVLLLTTISSLAPGSSCTISVVAVYDGIGMSNTVSSTANTLTLGIIIVIIIVKFIKKFCRLSQLLLVLLKDSLTHQWRAGH